MSFQKQNVEPMDTAVQVIDKKETIAEQSLEFFDLVSTEKKTPRQLASESGLSIRTVYNRINQGREIVEQQIRTIADKYIADVWKKYEYIYAQAREGWDATKDPFFLKEMRSVLEAQRKMLSLDNPAKAAVNPDGTAHTDTLMLVFDDSNYKKSEEEYQKKVLEGTYTQSGIVSSETDENSTIVPLSDDEIESNIEP